MAINITALPDYVEQNKIGLISKAVLGARTLEYVNIQTGIVGKTAINLLNTDVELGDGSTCGWDEAGESTLSQREIDPALLKVNMSFCDKKMAKTFASYQVKMAAGRANLPFEQAFIDDVLKNTNAKLDNIIWNGVTVDVKEYNGYLDILAEDASGRKQATGESVYGTFLNVYKAIPAEVLDKAVIFCGMDTYRDLVMELTAKNLYHYNPSVDTAYETVFPGTTTKVVAVPGLNGSDTIVAANPEHMFYGTDMVNDDEVFKFWYSDDNQEFRLAIGFAAGVQFAFPDQVTWASTSADEGGDASGDASGDDEGTNEGEEGDL